MALRSSPIATPEIETPPQRPAASNRETSRRSDAVLNQPGAATTRMKSHLKFFQSCPYNSQWRVSHWFDQ